tara:strand:- start:3046 stop:3441 length:396 start_codon:yes stop_codon:yes gene_type:complete
MAENEDQSIDNPFLTRHQRQMRQEDEEADRMEEEAERRSRLRMPEGPAADYSRALEESINTPEAQAILAEEELRMKNQEREDEGLPPLPTPEEQEKSNQDTMRWLRERSARKATQLPTTYAQAPLAADTDE